MIYISAFITYSGLAKKALRLLCLILVSYNGLGQARYTWQPVAGNAWSSALNWSPTRVLPAADDILVFDGALTATPTITLDFASPQTIGQLLFTNGVRATLNTDAVRTLAIGAQPPAAGLQLEAGTTVKIVGTQGNISSLALQLAAGTKAAIAGRLDFLGLASVGTGCPHALISNTAGAIEFASGSYFWGGTKFTGNPFGALKSSTGAVVFHSGATFEQTSGGSAFGDKTWSVATFEPGSLFLFTATSGSVGLSGRTFGSLTVNTNRTAPVASYGASKTVVAGDLTIASGTHTFNLQALDVQGNLLLNGGNLVFTSVDNSANPVPNPATLLTFNGSTAQGIAGTGTLTMGPSVSVALNNAAGLTLQHPLPVYATLTLTQGLLTTTAANGLTLGPLATTSGGSASSFVNGPLNRLLATSAATDLFFPVGSGTAYRPLTLRAEQTDATETRYTAQQFNQAPPARALPTAPGSVQQVSAVRYFNVTNNGATNFSQGTITLNYAADDQVSAPDKLRIAKSDNVGNWLDLGGAGTGAPVGSITSTVPFASFSDFVLASTDPASRPLPVQLAGFAARRHAGGVQLQWATASERNNSCFEVQRSTDGQAFARVTSVPGHGNSSASLAYAFFDSGAPAGTALYYRLRQVDADGTNNWSPVATVPVANELMRVFPVPAHECVSFVAEAGGTYRILDLLGQPVLQGPAAAGPNTLALSRLGPGVYYLELTDGPHQERHRFVKE